MNSSLLLTAFLMGLFGGPHCLAMCGATCVGLSHAKAVSGHAAVLGFQLGRLMGYSTLGAVGAFSVQGVGWLSIHSSLFRPVWGLFHVSALLIGLVLIWRADQPFWLNTFAQEVWRKISHQSALRTLSLGRFGPLALGVIWALLPCGLLYSALWVAALSANPLEGALVMSSFAMGSALVLTTGPLIWRAIKSIDNVHTLSFKSKSVITTGSIPVNNSASMQGALGVRLAGLALVGVSSFALWHGLIQNQAPWCVSNP